MKLVYLVTTLKRSGPINILFNLISNPLLRDSEIHVISIFNEPVNTRLEEFKEYPNVVIHNLNLSKYNILFIGPLKFSKIIKSINPDIIHSHGLLPDIFNSLLLKKINKVSTIHCYFFDDYRLKFGNKKGWILSRLHLFFVKRIKYPVACSKSLSELYDTKRSFKINYIQNGIIVKESQKTTQNAGLRNQFVNNEASKRIMISVGSLIKRKDPLLLLNAFIESKSYETFSLIFLGDGPLRSLMEEIALPFKQSIFILGNVSNVIDFLSISDVFVTTSNSEGLPNTVLEAMSVGLTIVASDIPQHKELFMSNPNGCIFFPSGNKDKLIDCLIDIGKKTLLKPNHLVMEIVNQCFTSDVMTSNYLSLYKSILSNGK
jgi:glycosyltransferase involved in cell wall biosynthesis